MKDRNVFFRVIILICVIVVALSVLLSVLVYLYKKLSGSIEINVDLGLLLSILLALFSIGLSLAFFFKANETSDNYFKHSYDIMKDQSILLGRIEERFGEKLGSVQTALSSLVAANDRLESLVTKDQKIQDYLKNTEGRNVDPNELLSLLNDRNVDAIKFNEIVDSISALRKEIVNKSSEDSIDDRMKYDYEQDTKRIYSIIRKVMQVGVNEKGYVDIKNLSITDYRNGRKYGLFDENGKLTDLGFSLLSDKKQQ